MYHMISCPHWELPRQWCHFHGLRIVRKLRPTNAAKHDKLPPVIPKSQALYICSRPVTLQTRHFRFAGNSMSVLPILSYLLVRGSSSKLSTFLLHLSWPDANRSVQLTATFQQLLRHLHTNPSSISVTRNEGGVWSEWLDKCIEAWPIKIIMHLNEVCRCTSQTMGWAHKRGPHVV
jgi:hypothetical protein